MSLIGMQVPVIMAQPFLDGFKEAPGTGPARLRSLAVAFIGDVARPRW